MNQFSVKPAGGQANAADVVVLVGGTDVEHASWRLLANINRSIEGNASISPAIMAFDKLLLLVGMMIID